MSGGRTLVEYVIGSTVRSTVLQSVASGSRTTDELLESLDASESAVYGALNELEERGLLVAESDGYDVTGAGQIVTDLVTQVDRTERLFATDAAYWESHDLSVLPAEFRTRLPDLAGCEIVRATDSDPHRVVRRVAQRLEGSDRASIITPIYQDEYATGLPDGSEIQLLFDHGVLEDIADEQLAGGAEPPAGTATRMAEVSFALTVTDDCVMLSLPRIDGTYDTRTELIAEHDAAMNWGEQLFAHYWQRATPIE